MSEPLPDAGLSALERSLSRLTPAPAALARDRVLFEAGRASARRGWFWPGVAAASSVAATVLGVLLLSRPADVVHEHTVQVRLVPVPAPAPETPSLPTEATSAPAPDEAVIPPESEYLRRRQEVLRWGVDALPRLPPPGPTHQPLTAGSLRGGPGNPNLY